MLKAFLHRLFKDKTELPEPSDLPLSPLTVMAVEPELPPVELINVDNLFFPWLLGAGQVTAEALNEAESRVLRVLKRSADADDASVADLVPRIPSIVPLLLRSLRDPNISNSELAAQTLQDAVLVAAVLKQMNSSYFRRATPVKTIEDALALIGQNGLRMLVASVAFKPLFNADLGRVTTLGAPRTWELADPYGAASRYLARRRQVDEFEVFLAGLLQNVGIVVALRLMDRAGVAAEGELRSLAFYGSFVHYTRRLARLVGRHWEFPERAIAAIGQEGPETETVLARVLHVADRTTKIHTLVNHQVLRPELADACLEDEDAAECYRILAAAERDSA
jgi:HD-like signal output (HDOD) protein